ncbi:MAG: protein kinase [Butyrivibrio sp.]|nr:protein kinase [Butyrivibrio sp.]
MFFSKEILDTYDIVGEIGKGGGGTIFEAYHKRLQKKVVLKRQHDSIRGLVNERTETDTLKNLRHSNLPQVLDFLVTDDAIYTVMDYIPGKSVKALLDEKGKLTEDEVIKYAKQLCEALVYLHSATPPVIHGDIKPDNIMITPDGDVCLIDFNISSALGAVNSYAFGYTLGYAAPEQRKSFEIEKDRLKRIAESQIQANDKTELIYEKTEILVGGDSSSGNSNEQDNVNVIFAFDKRSDIYSFGATLYHMLTGKKPSSDGTGTVPVLDIYPLMNRGLAEIITKSMCLRPEDRFQSFNEIKKILDNIKKYDLKYKAKVVRRIIIGGVAAVVLGTAVAVSLIYLKNTGNKNYKEVIDKATKLYQDMDYEGSIDLINTELINKYHFAADPNLVSTAYHLRGNDWFELEQYEYALDDYYASVSYVGGDATIYRDEAIALARLNRTDEALDILDEAKAEGLGSADLLLANAEVESMAGNNDKAIELYLSCAEQSDDNTTKARAYMQCADLYKRDDESQLREAIGLLEKASAIDSDLKAGIMERLAQGYIDLVSVSGDDSSYADALEIFDRIVDNRWDTYTTHNNMAIIYEQMDDLDAAENELQSMLDKYGDNYNTYKRLAFLEVEKQNKNLGTTRDYSAFKEYGEKALSLYGTQNLVTNDMEINVLEELLSQVQ